MCIYVCMYNCFKMKRYEFFIMFFVREARSPRPDTGHNVELELNTDCIKIIKCDMPFMRSHEARQCPGVTGQNIPPAELYPGLKRPWLDYTRVYYGLGQFIPRVYCGLGQFIPPQAKLYIHDINHDINSVERYA